MAFRLGCPSHDGSLNHLVDAARQINWLGRLQMLDISSITGLEQPVLLDGAHNTQSAEVLASYVQKRLRSTGRVVTWVLAASQGKDMEGILRFLLRPGDIVAAVKFRAVDGMPWVKPADPAAILDVASGLGIPLSGQHSGSDNLVGTLKWAGERAGNGPVVIAGSLYLVSDVLRLLRQCI
jgi:folylpolyglutamate synthase